MRGKTNERKCSKAVVCLILAFFLAVNAGAVGIGVSPGTVNFAGVLRSGYAEKTVILSTSSEEPVKCEVYAEGPFKDWLRFSPGKTFTVPPKSQLNLKIIAEPPEDVPNGVYEGFITVAILPKDRVGGGTGSSVVAAVSLISSVEISDVERLNYRIMDVLVKDTEERRDIEVFLTIDNDGNVRIVPDIHVDILDEDKTTVLESADYSEKTVNPTTVEEIMIKIPNSLPVGKYFARITAKIAGEKMAEKFVGFEVLERGSLSIQGKLLKVELNKIWVYTGEIVEIKAAFKNDGILSTSAVFKGKATIEDTVVDVLESEEVEIPTGQVGELTAYFTPKKQGRYSIIGRVYYSKKVTPEKSSVLNVKPSEEPSKTAPVGEKDLEENADYLSIIALIAVFILVAAGFLFYKRKREQGPRIR